VLTENILTDSEAEREISSESIQSSHRWENAMPEDITCSAGCAVTTLAPVAPGDEVEDGWQILAEASLRRLLTDAELAAVHHLPVEIALDLLFPDLDDAARHEALWALG
jgi:hypothetical protein